MLLEHYNISLYCVLSCTWVCVAPLLLFFTSHTDHGPHPIPRMRSVQMGRASDTCSIKGIRGDLTTLLSASWPHIDQHAGDHSQPVWHFNLDPAHAHRQIRIFTNPEVMQIHPGFGLGNALFICKKETLLVQFHSLPKVKVWVKKMCVF